MGNPSIWHRMTDDNLIEMGFKSGHRAIFYEILNSYNLQNSGDHILSLFAAWSLPLGLVSKMHEFGWSDPDFWTEINDSDFKELGFQRGHVIIFKNRVKNGDHIQKLQILKEEKTNNGLEEEQMNNNDDVKEEIADDDDDDEIDDGKQEIEPTFNIDASTVTHEQFWYKLDEMNDSYDYYLEIKCGKTDHWLKKKRITNKKRNNIFDLKWDTNYRVRIRAENKRNKKISYSK